MAKTVAELNLPASLKYTDEHIWARVEGDEIVVGVSDYAQDQLGEVESIKSVNKLFMPVAGEVTAVNGELADTPTLLNASCYEKGWLIKVKPEDMAAVDALMSADAYKATL